MNRSTQSRGTWAGCVRYMSFKWLNILCNTGGIKITWMISLELMFLPLNYNQLTTQTMRVPKTTGSFNCIQLQIQYGAPLQIFR